MRQLVTEGVLFGVGGGIVGVALSAAILKFLVSLAAATTPGLAGAAIDRRVLLLAMTVSVAFALVFAIVPALVLSRVGLAGASSSARIIRGGRGRLQETLIVGELTLATVLLFGAGLLTKTMHRLGTVDPGFVPEGLLTVRVAPVYSRFVEENDRAGLRSRINAYFDQLAGALRGLPGSFVIRTTGDPAALTAGIRPALWSVDPALPVTQIIPMRDRMGESVVEQRYRMRLMIAFSTLAILFAVAGLYGVLSRSVARRRRELGIRAALGAGPTPVLRLEPSIAEAAAAKNSKSAFVLEGEL